MSAIVNKVKEVLHKDHTSTTTGTHTGAHTTSGTAEGVAGPHNSRVANAADPRVDSDRDGSHKVGGTTGTTGTTGFTGTHTTAHTASGNGYNGVNTHSGTAEGVAGPHNSRVANAADPRVDSDRDGSHKVGGTTGTTGVTGSHTVGNTHSGSTVPPHNNALLNKLDPRVDTTHTAVGNTTHTTGGHTHATGTTGGLSSSTNAGPHDSNFANKIDPTVDSDLDGRGNRTGASKAGVFGASGSHATAGSGTAQNTAGPHNSDLANKIDPRVDSDLSGGGGIAGSRTYQ